MLQILWNIVFLWLGGSEKRRQRKMWLQNKVAEIFVKKNISSLFSFQASCFQACNLLKIQVCVCAPMHAHSHMHTYV